MQYSLLNLIFTLSILGSLVAFNRSQPTDPSEVNVKTDQTANLNGTIRQDPRIVGGGVVPDRGIKHQLYFMYKDNIECGASLVDLYDVQVAITATHCLWTGYPNHDSLFDTQFIDVVAGALHLNNPNPDREQTVKVAKIVAHPDYDPTTFTHDIALMFLASKIKYTVHIGPIALPGHDWEVPHNVHISGWGSTVFGGSLVNYMRYANLPTVEQYACEKFNLIPAIEINDKQFCAGDIGGMLEGSCTGDSGGPAEGYNSTFNMFYLTGIVSFGISYICGSPVYPTVYTRVSKYVDWIRIETSKFKESQGK